MDFYAVLDQILALLRQRGRVSYWALKRQFDLDDAYLDDLKVEIIEVHQCAVDQEGTILVWTGKDASVASPEPVQAPAPLAYTPLYLAEKILTSRSALEGERKQVTVLFADLKGSMELLADRDPEEARQLLDPVLERMMAAVHRYEGTVNQVMGDGIMALFGAPIAHEDHAVRACYAALAMQDTIRRYSEAVRRSHGVEMQIRVGLNLGDVVVRAIGNDLHMDYSAIGQTTPLAARMEQLAPPGSIRLTTETLRRAEGWVQVTPLGPVPVKGLPAPVEVYELVGAGPAHTRLQAFAARGLTPFVGRQAELAALHQALDQARVGHGQVVAVVGEPGVGKTRLFHEFTHGARTQGWLLLESSAASYGQAIPYWPIIDLLQAYFHLEDRDDGWRRREKLTGRLLTLDPALGPSVPAFLALLEVPVDDPPWLALDPAHRRQRTLDALQHLLLRESQAQPLLLVFDSLHWIDAETQAFLNGVVENLPTARILLVNYRPEYQHPWGSRTYYTQLRLNPLGQEEAHNLLTALLGEAPGLHALKELMLAKTAGNPFFMEEIVQTLVEQGLLVREVTAGGHATMTRLTGSLTTLQLPPTIQGVLAARIDRLAEEEKALLQILAVIGRAFPLSLLTHVVGQPEGEVRGLLTRLQRGEFIYEQPAFPELEYTFKHPLTQEVAYHSLLLERRRALHERPAQAIEALFQDRLEDHYSELTHHYSRSGNTAKAVEYLQRAGQQAVQRAAYAEAISHVTTALDLLGTLPDTLDRDQQELVLQTTLAQAWGATKGVASPEVERATTRARVLCQQVGETRHLFPVLSGLERMYRLRAELATARELAEQFLHLAQRTPDPVHLAQAHWMLGMNMYALGELVTARTYLEQAMTIYDAQSHGVQVVRSLPSSWMWVSCLSSLAWVLWLLGYPDQALARSQEALTGAQEQQHPYSLVHALSYAAALHQFRRERVEAQARAEAAIILAAEQGFPFWGESGTMRRGWALAVQGHGEEGIAQIQQGLAAMQTTGAKVGRAHWLAILAEAYGHVGQTQEGLSMLAEALATVHNHGVRWWEAELYRLKGELLLRQAGGQDGETETCFQHAFTVARRQQAKSLELRAAMSLARLWQHQGKRDAARQVLAESYGWFTEGFDTEDLQEAKALLDTLA